MYIVGDEKRHSGFPWVTVLLVLANFAVFWVQVGLDPRFTYGYCLVPVEIVRGEDLVGETPPTLEERGNGPVVRGPRATLIPHEPGPRPIYLTLVTSMFLHADLMHLLGNLAFLLAFGRNVERALGRVLFLAFYLFCGVVASLVDVSMAPNSAIPCVGASGAISAVIGAYFFLYPFNWMKVWILVLVVEVPAFVFIGVWVFLQTLGTLDAVKTGAVTGGVAYWAHVGGFAAGLGFLLTLFLSLHALRLLRLLNPWPGTGPARRRPRPGMPARPRGEGFGPVEAVRPVPLPTRPGRG